MDPCILLGAPQIYEGTATLEGARLQPCHHHPETTGLQPPRCALVIRYPLPWRIAVIFCAVFLIGIAIFLVAGRASLFDRIVGFGLLLLGPVSVLDVYMFRLVIFEDTFSVRRFYHDERIYNFSEVVEAIPVSNRGTSIFLAPPTIKDSTMSDQKLSLERIPAATMQPERFAEIITKKLTNHRLKKNEEGS
jgi:hypothetical protein